MFDYSAKKIKLVAFKLICVLNIKISARSDDAQLSCRWRGAERNLCARHEFVKFTW